MMDITVIPLIHYRQPVIVKYTTPFYFNHLTSVLLTLISLTAIAQKQYNPENLWSLNRPKEFCDFVGQDIANTYYSSGNLENLNYNSGYQWKVWCAQGSTPVMSKASTTSPKKGELNFKQRVIVTDVKGSWLQISRDQDNEQPYGWVNSDNLLLSPYALKTSGGIGRKALVVPNLGVQSTPEQQLARTQLYNHPNVSNKDAMSGIRAGRFKVLYILKESSSAMLLSKAPLLNGSSANATILGWMPKRYLTEWNRRVAYAPSWGTNAPIGEEIPFFDSKSSLTNYINSCDDSKASQRGKVIANELVPEVPAFPDIGSVNDGALGNVKRELLTIVGISNNPEAIENDIIIKDKIRLATARISKINLLFVVDATASMGKYYPAIANSIQEVNKWTQAWSETVNINVGFGIYRDYPDGEECVPSPAPVRAFNKVMQDYISTKVECKSKDRDKPEAVYKGLLDNLNAWNPSPNETNIVILIGDEGNHANDPNYSANQVQDKLDDINASLFVFQATAFMTESSMRFQADALEWINNIQASNAKNNINSNLIRKNPGVFGIEFNKSESIINRRQALLITQAEHAGRKTSPQAMASTIKKDLEGWIRAIESQIEGWEGACDGTRKLTPEEKEYAINGLVGPNVTREQAEDFFKRGGDLAIKAHASIKSCNEEAYVMTPYIFLSNEDYNRISNAFARLEAGGTTVEKAEALQSMCLSLIRTQAGSAEEVERYRDKKMGEIWIEFFQVDFNISSLKDVTVRNIPELSSQSGQVFEDAYETLLEAAETWNEMEILDREWRIASTPNQKYYWVDAEFFPGFSK